MHKLKSLDTYRLKDRGQTVYMVESPIAAPRERAAYLAALGEVEIDGKVREVAGIEWNVPNSPVYVGEKIGLAVRE